MPTDEVAHGAEADESRERTGHRRAAPRKPLFNRFHTPVGKAMIMAAMPTAVLMGMGGTSTLAVADNNPSVPSAKSLTIDEYKECVAALDDSEDSEDKDKSKDKGETEDAEDAESKDKASAEPTPSASASAGAPAEDGRDGRTGSAEPAPAAPSSAASGPDGKAAPQPSATASESEPDGRDAEDTAAPEPSESASRDGGLLKTIGDTLENVLTGGKQASGAEESPASEATPSASATSSADGTGQTAAPRGGNAPDTAGGTPQKATDTAKDDAARGTAGTESGASGAAGDTGKATEGAADEADRAGKTGEATASPSPSASSTTDPENCPVATDAEGGVDNTVPLADHPWYLDASSLLLMGADYQGIVKVRTANGTVKRVLKYVVSDGTDIGDLHQTVRDERAGRTYHVQAAKGSMSKIRGDETVMYTESISGMLFGLLPVKFSPDNPPPLNLPLIYFTDVHVVQAAQFGGNLHVPGMHVYTTG